MEPPDVYDYWYYDDEIDRDIEQLHAEEQASRRKEFEDVTTFASAYTDDEEFELMWPAVHAICESLRHEPQNWHFHENRFKNLKNGTEYWSYKLKDPVTETWDCGTTKVFSVRQGERILEAMQIAQKYKRVTEPQKKLISQLGLDNTEIVDARKIVLPKLTFWQRLLYLVTARCKIN